jgi:uncharacterized protein YbaR (Trm112 family)
VNGQLATIEPFDCRVLCCPACKGDLAIGDSTLTCSSCSRSYPIVDGIPRLLHFEGEDERYNDTWDYKWVALDGGNG